MVKLKPICNFVEWELDKFRNECNFTEDERKCFELKAKGKSIVYIASELNVSESTVNRLVKKIKKKIIKVL